MDGNQSQLEDVGQERSQARTIIFWGSIGILALFVGVLALYYSPHLRARVLSGPNVAIVDPGDLVAGDTTVVQFDVVTGFAEYLIESSSLEFCYGMFMGTDCVYLQHIDRTEQSITVIVPERIGGGYLQLVNEDAVFALRPARIVK